MKKLICAFIFLLPVLLYARQPVFRGTVSDTAGEPVPFVTVIVLTADSVMVEAVLSGADGVFGLGQTPADGDRIIAQHLSYETVVMSGSGVKTSGVIIMPEKENAIEDVVVKGERPLVSIIDNKISYDAQVLARDRIVTNAYDVLRELPGITGNDDELKLVGAGGFTIVINGQITSMSLPQLFTLLKSIPAVQVRRLNVAYNAPAKYNFNGAVIEVELMENTGYEGTTGELSAGYVDQFYSSGNLRGNLNVEKEKYSLNFLAHVSHGKSVNEVVETDSRHYYSGEYYDINQLARMTAKGSTYSFRGAGDYRFDDGGRINLSYYYSGSGINAMSNGGTRFFKNGAELRDAKSSNHKKADSHLHNVHIQYDGAVTAGADYTRFNSPDDGRYNDSDNGITQTDYRYEFAQKVDKINLFLNNTSTVDKWKLSYGLNFTTARSDNNSGYFFTAPASGTTQTVSRQSEYFANGFFEAGRQLSPKTSFKLGIKGEYQYSNIETDGAKHNLWSEWTVYPDMSLSYMVSSNHMLQFNLTSDKAYPPYWALSANESQLNAYAYIRGNPGLKPSRSYNAQASYVLKQKYVLVGFAGYYPDIFRQMPYQPEDELQMVYEMVNFDFQFQYGFALVVPFSIGNFLNSRVTVQVVQMVDRIKDFHGINIRNGRFVSVVSMDNTFPLYHGKTQKIDLQVDARYQGRAVQGIFDLGRSYLLDAGLKWTVNDKFSASAKWDNILRRQIPQPITVDWGTQSSRMVQREFRSFRINLVWKFGRYEEKEFRKVDSSRFGKN